jgi:uncharacterized protein YjbI with pentapeptide repeats
MSEERNSPAPNQKNKTRRWRPSKKQILWAVGLGIALIVAILVRNRLGFVPLVLVLLFILIRIGYRYEWTGFGGTSRPKDDKREIKPPKTLWDWMQLLFVPAMLAILAAGLAWWQTSSERAMQAREEARQEAIRAEEAAVQSYLDQMTALLLDLDLRTSQKDSEVRTIAQARTMAVLRVVGPDNRRTLLLFLYDAGLINKEGTIISLDGADLVEAHLSNANLSDAELSGTDLSDAELRDANLSFAILNNANLSGADLSDANLEGVSMSFAKLSNADLEGAFLARAFLGGTDLSNADLSGAAFYGADLGGANLRDAEGVTNEELHQQALSLVDAIMPNGQKYEDWLKDK